MFLCTSEPLLSRTTVEESWKGDASVFPPHVPFLKEFIEKCGLGFRKVKGDAAAGSDTTLGEPSSAK